MLWILDHFWALALGYALCVVLPCPFISRAVLRQWNNLGDWIKARI